MKKTLSIVIVAALLMMRIPFIASAKVGNVNLNYGTVTIDGEFSADKWAAAAPLTIDASNTDSWAWGDAMEASFTVYALWDEQGLYLGGEVKDSDVELSGPGNYSGDAVQFSLDLGQILLGADERGIFYSFGLQENASETGVQRQESPNDMFMKNGDEGIKIQAKATAAGWVYELFMPWTMLNNDVSEKGGKKFTPAEGGKIDALICYLDKDIAASGTFKKGSDPWTPGDHGATFILQAKPAEVESSVINEAQNPVISGNEISAAANEPNVANEQVVQEKPADTIPAAVNTGDTFTVFLVFILTSAAVFIIYKKKSAVK